MIYKSAYLTELNTYRTYLLKVDVSGQGRLGIPNSEFRLPTFFAYRIQKRVSRFRLQHSEERGSHPNYGFPKIRNHSEAPLFQAVSFKIVFCCLALHWARPRDTQRKRGYITGDPPPPHEALEHCIELLLS